MQYAATITSRTADLPLTLAEAKSHLRKSGDELESEIQATLEAAVSYCEAITGRSLRVTTTLTQVYPQWPCDPVRFDREPVKAISSVTYYDQDGNSQTVASSNYRLIPQSESGAHLEWDDDFTKPTLDTRDDAVTITYTAGYDDIASVPATAKQAIKLKLSELFGELDPREADNYRRSCNDLLSAIDWGVYR